MRPFLVLFALTLLLATGTLSLAGGERVFLGTVVSVDAERGLLEVRPLHDGLEEGADSPDAVLRVIVPRETWFSDLRPGALVRVSGTYVPGGMLLSEARVELAGPPTGGGDGTGVRRRLGKMGGFGRGAGGGRGR